MPTIEIRFEDDDPRRRPSRRRPPPRKRRRRPPNGGAGIIALLFVACIAVFGLHLGGKLPFEADDTQKGKQTSSPAPPKVTIKDFPSFAQPCRIPASKEHSAAELNKSCQLAKAYAWKKLQAQFKQTGEAKKQFKCLDTLWDHEANWNTYAVNPTSKAYGVPQVHPKVHGPNVFKLSDWKAQVDWGSAYINRRYKTPCGAWTFWQNPTVHIPGASKNWY